MCVHALEHQYCKLGGELDELDDVVGSEEEDEEEDDEEEWHHFPRPPVQEVCPGDHLRDCYEVFFPNFVCTITSSF